MSKGIRIAILLLMSIIIIGVLFLINSPKQNTDWICIPGKKAGPITSKTTETELKRIFGAKNVSSSKQLVAEGTKEITATYIYKGTKNELEIRWEENQTFQEIAGVIINNPGGNWKTFNGITVGTSLEELNQINGKPFKFMGFEWDLGGWIFDWGNGNLHDKKIGANLMLTVTNDDYSNYLGHVEINSDDPVLKKFKIQVSRLCVTL